MDITTIAIALITALLGGLIGYFVSASRKQKPGYSDEQYNQVQEQMEATKTALAVANDRIASLSGTHNIATSQLEQLRQDHAQIQVAHGKSTTELEQAKEELLLLRRNKEETAAKQEALNGKLAEAGQSIAQLRAQLDSKEQQLAEQKKHLEDVGNKMKDEFKLIAGDILKNSSKQLTEQQETNLRNILTPFKENISKFQQEIVSRYNDETKERATLKAEIKHMMELNNQLSKDADNLAKAFKNNTKHQGDWGEMILERILDYVGLKKDIHYSVQVSGKNEEGTRIRPDVLVKYPDNKILVIDSKVSLVHYERFCNTQDEEEQQAHVNQLVSSIKGHIDGLKGKQYDNLPGALDSVMMFVPVEAAFITAQQAEPSLWQYAYDRGIILLSPTILLGAMKLVYDYWKRDEATRNAQEIAEKAGGMYNKLVDFVTDMDNIGSYLHKAKTSWEKGYNKLTEGKGNLVSRATQMKKLGIKAKKELPEPLVNTGLLEDGIEVEEEGATTE